MLKKIFQPKELAIITIVLCIIYIVVNLINDIFISGIWSLLNALFRNILDGSIYFIIYLLIILFAQKKDIRKLNLIFIIQIGISFFMSFISELSSLFQELALLLLLVMMIGIYLHKKIPYKIIMIISLFVLCIEIIGNIKLFVVGNSWSLYGYGLYMLGIIIRSMLYNMALCSLTMFMYQYGKSISERK